ncbi:MAG: VOC family protein [Chloroflexi bacterium]|nr:MAG: VOC family protein [Chloroflexota bacterium]
MSRIRANLWFDTQAEDAARLYVDVFKDSKLGGIARYPEAGQEIHGKPAGSVMTVGFELNGQTFVALNGGPQFAFNEAVSFEIDCADQAELDYYWDRLTEGGDPDAQQCGWLKDRFDVSWQVVPRASMERMIGSPDTEKSQRAFQAMLGIKKLDIAALERAFEG